MDVEESIRENSNTDVRNPIFLDRGDVAALLSFPSLINHLQFSLPLVSTSIQSPLRQNFPINPCSSLLLMPSWSTSPSLPFIGVKIVTSFPQNSARNLPGINASYVLFDSSTGQTLSMMDGTEITLWRTACVSALAAKYLVRQDAEVLVMIGAGSLASYLISAHLAAIPSLKKVVVWNRTAKKAQDLAKEMEEGESGSVSFQHGECLDEVVAMADVVSCATRSEIPLVRGKLLKAGAHLDLVGSFNHSMRECDDEAIGRGRVFVDNEAALVESGELVGAFDRGVISRGDIGGTLLDLIKGDKVGRSSSDEVTVFKSVGSAVVDILTAQLVYETRLIEV
ncbi:protein SAR DEFICIENT 4 [Magnolia sinica]|uniref:protein SAR DEFICIENT 4 n=1 Tax=Magnolia sinica TaxID=86752 RepID=UPI002658E8F8|nr:protein SAR DEFICIENT 4 [Magnolia sinica]XP_058105671.1 protein SAR DEFICIENT 4 [Magnolia sinica]